MELRLAKTKERGGASILMTEDELWVAFADMVDTPLVGGTVKKGAEEYRGR